MATIYDKFRGISNRLITKYGFAAVLRRYTTSGSEFNPTRTVVDENVLTVDIGNRVVGINPATNVAVRERQFLIAGGQGVVPEKGDILVIGTEEYEVTAVNTTNPGNVDVLYELSVAT